MRPIYSPQPAKPLLPEWLEFTIMMLAGSGAFALAMYYLAGGL